MMYLELCFALPPSLCAIRTQRGEDKLNGDDFSEFSLLGELFEVIKLLV